MVVAVTTGAATVDAPTVTFVEPDALLYVAEFDGVKLAFKASVPIARSPAGIVTTA